MKLDLALVALELPNTVMPTICLGVGPEDTAEKGKTDLYGTTAAAKQRRAMSVSFSPADKSKPEAEVIQGEINRVQLGCRGKVIRNDDRAAGGVNGKYVEFEYTGPTQLPLVSMVFVMVAGGVLQTYTYTALKSPALDEARKEFLTITDSVKPGSMYAKK